MERPSLKGIALTAVRVLVAPAAFFRKMPRSGGYWQPIVFMAAMGVVVALSQALLAAGGRAAGGRVLAGAASLVIVPVLTAAAGFVWAAIMFAVWRAMGSKAPFETAFRCVAYLTVLTPLNLALRTVPYLGPISTPYLLAGYLAVASVEAHRIPRWKAWPAFGLLAALLAFLALR